MDWLGTIPVTLVAEHGGFIRLHDHKTWRKTNQHSLAWEKSVTKLLEDYSAQTPVLLLSARNGVLHGIIAMPHHFMRKKSYNPEKTLKADS